MLLAGIFSDTLNFSSPTTTERDRRAADRISRWAFSASSPLKGESIDSFGEEVIKAGAGISTRDPNEIVSSDTKTYSSGGLEFAIAQAEVTDLLQVDKQLNELRTALDNLKSSRGLDFAMLMVTDVVKGDSRLVIVNPPPTFDDLPYPAKSDGTRSAKGLVSRKKQLLPVILSLLET
jgi:manganese-dependent inorganic pyrophosphatase